MSPGPRSHELDLLERQKLLGCLSPEQMRRLLENDWVWTKQDGVIWKPQGGGVRRTRFTHGAYFATQHGSFRIDSEGSVRALPAESSTAPGSAPTGEIRRTSDRFTTTSSSSPTS